MVFQIQIAMKYRSTHIIKVLGNPIIAESSVAIHPISVGWLVWQMFEWWIPQMIIYDKHPKPGSNPARSMTFLSVVSQFWLANMDHCWLSPWLTLGFNGIVWFYQPGKISQLYWITGWCHLPAFSLLINYALTFLHFASDFITDFIQSADYLDVLVPVLTVLT